MRIRNGIAAGLIAGLLGFGVAALAQSIVPFVPSIGQSDAVQVIQGGVGTATNRYANAGWVGGMEQYSFQVPLTGFTITIPAHTSVMMINPAGTLATGTYTMEANPSDGQRVCIVSTQTQTAVTIAANTGQTIGGLAVPAAGTANVRMCFTYVATTATWYHYTMN